MLHRVLACAGKASFLQSEDECSGFSAEDDMRKGSDCDLRTLLQLVAHDDCGVVELEFFSKLEAPG